MFVLKGFTHYVDLIDDNQRIKEINNRQQYHDDFKQGIAGSLIVKNR